MSESVAPVTTWARWALRGWALWGLAGAALEAWCLHRYEHGWPPLTRVIVKYIPRWLALGAIAWLAQHFYHAYQD